MKKLIILFIFALSACTTTTHYTISVNSQSLPDEDLQNNKTCKLEYIGDKNQKSIDAKEFTKQIEYVLNQHDIKLVDNKKASCIIGFSYDIEGPFTQEHSEPVIGVVGTQSSTSYTNGMVHSYGNMAYGSATTNTVNFPQYGVTGYRNYTTQYFNRWLSIASVDKDGSELWHTRISSSGSNNDLSEIFPLMAHIANKTIMTNTKENIDISESEAKKIREQMHSRQ